MNKGVLEAKKLVKEGDEALKTGVFKWNKDYATAAISYDEAAKLYRAAKEYDTAIKIYEKCAHVNGKINDNWGIARNYEAIVTMCIERTDGVKTSPEALESYASKVKTYCRMENSIQTYINLVKKLSKYLEDNECIVQASNIYKELLNDLEEDGQHHVKGEVVTSYATLLVKTKKYGECITLFERELATKKEIQSKTGTRQNLDTLALTIITLYVVVGDLEKAEKRLQDFSIDIRDFIKTSEFDVSEKMIEAYNEGNQENFDKTVSRTVFNNIFPLHIIKDLRKVKVQMKMKKAIKKKSLHLEDDEQIQSQPAYENFNNDDTTQQDVTNYTSKVEANEPEPAVNEEQRQKELDDFMS